MAIRKLKNGRYQVDVVDKNGKRLRRNFSKLVDAKSLETLLEKEKLDEKRIANNIIKRKVTFDEAILKATKSKESLAPKSVAKYKNIFATFGKFVKVKGLININDFTPDDADDFKDILTNSGSAAKTINFYLNTVKGVFREYVVRNVLIKNPFEHIALERVKKKTLLEREKDYYSTEEIKNFFSQDIPEKYCNCFIGLFLSGMRFGELSSLKWIRIDWENRLFLIRSDESFQTKTVSSERDIPISNKLFIIIKSMKEKSTSEYVFSNSNGKMLSERTMLSVCKSVAEKAGIIKNATLHKWRHSFSSHLSQLGVDYSVRQYLLGHKPQTMTDHYTKLDAKKLHKEVSKLDDLIP